ncbi:MAG TPA: hypothetical protein VGW38_22500 [Chloroflexota bacterium]|nr:hypothetical protein [Chloroflexota bacterium]
MSEETEVMNCRTLFLLILLSAPMLVACTPAYRATEGSLPALFVLNGGDGTLSVHDAQTGRLVQESAAMQPKPLSIEPGPGGTVLLLVQEPPEKGGIAVLQTSVAAGGSPIRKIDVATHGRSGLLASNRGSFAAVAYRDGRADGDGNSLCQIAVLDVDNGTMRRVRRLCGEGEQIRSLAVLTDEQGSVVYAGIWRWRVDGSSGERSGGQVVALDAASGVVLAVGRLPAIPAKLLPARSPDGSGRLLYVVEEQPDEHASANEAEARPRIIGVDIRSLTVETVFLGSSPAQNLAMDPDGRTGYVLSTDRNLWQIDLVSGGERHIGKLPSAGVGLAVAGSVVYVANPYGTNVWAVDATSGRLRSITTGKRPIALLASSDSQAH